MSNRAFTLTYQGIANALITDIYISEPIPPNTAKKIDPVNHPKIFPFKALWDTGATNSAITSKTAAQLGLIPINQVWVNHAGGKSLENVYLVDIFLPNNLAIPGIRVTEAKIIQGNFDVIIGMNIITLGDFAVTNYMGRTCFSFSMPSIKTIDFVKDPPKPNLAHTPIRPQRNDPCYCGSKKKYKDCHGKHER
jgi:SEC-C motif/Aspartyl protease